MAELAIGEVSGNRYTQLLLLALPCFRRGRLSRCRIQLFGVLQGFPRELESLLAEFMSGSMIRLAVGGRCGGVGVRCNIMKFCGSVV